MNRTLLFIAAIAFTAWTVPILVNAIVWHMIRASEQYIPHAIYVYHVGWLSTALAAAVLFRSARRAAPDSQTDIDLVSLIRFTGLASLMIGLPHLFTGSGVLLSLHETGYWEIELISHLAMPLVLILQGLLCLIRPDLIMALRRRPPVSTASEEGESH